MSGRHDLTRAESAIYGGTEFPNPGAMEAALNTLAKRLRGGDRTNERCLGIGGHSGAVRLCILAELATDIRRSLRHGSRRRATRRD